jgi:hypothetical protein
VSHNSTASVIVMVMVIGDSGELGRIVSELEGGTEGGEREDCLTG